MYHIEFIANIDGYGGDELREKLDTFNHKNEILLNKKVREDYKCDITWLTCDTEERLLTRLLKVICDSFEINNLVVINLHPIKYEI